MSRIAPFLLISCLVVLSAPAEVSAEEGADARALFLRGVELFQQGEYEEAAGAFRQSYASNPAPIALLNLAMCQRELFQYVESIDTLEQFLAMDPDSLRGDQVATARRFMDEMTARIGTVRISLEPAHAVVTVDDAEVPPANLSSLRLRAGPHRVSARAEGYEEVSEDIQVVAQRVTEVPLSLAVVQTPPVEEPPPPLPPLPVAPPPPTTEVPDGATGDAPERTPVARRWGFWVGILGAAAAIGLGVGLGVGLSQGEEYPEADLETRLP